jgi:hypothetical protein
MLKGVNTTMQKKEVKDLEKQITEKNIILSSINHNERSNIEKIKSIKSELDKLLYIYYKSLKSRDILIGVL